MPRARLADLEGESVRVRAVPTVAVIDIGSNTARCVVFETSRAGTVRAIFETKDAPRLGSETGSDAALSPEAMVRGIATVRRFARIVRSLKVSRTLAVATSAVRDAPNGPEFVRDVARASGVTLRTVSGTEEARYAYLGVASAWQLSNDLVCDLGGGSLQLAEVRDGALRNSVSLPLGVLRLSQRFFGHDPPKRREYDALRNHVRSTLASVLEAFGGAEYRLFGIGGTVRSLARASIEFREYPVRRVHGYPLYGSDIEALEELLGEMAADRRRSVPGIGSDRADVVLAGIVIFSELLRAVDADRIVVSGTGIREGIALESLGTKLPASAEELAERSAAAASESFAFDLSHGQEVADTASSLFAVLASRFQGGPSEALALRVAAWMHDAGVAIDLWNHARHSAYLIQNYPIWGLDQREVILASIAAYLHEGNSVPSEWKKEFLPIIQPADLERAVSLGAVLGVAELLSPVRPRFSLSSDGTSLGVSFSTSANTTLPPRWAEKVRKPMERVFDLEVRFRDAS
ncbi:MAG TPA: Ppx/GppA phosphatase family protein [Thermoplasmata archaeon]|nr:Ppx/GppA phosphatase family protein [Thermoplasmata archaeon]